MTARPFWDPVTGAALTAGLLPILPGLPCPTCLPVADGQATLDLGASA